VLQNVQASQAALLCKRGRRSAAVREAAGSSQAVSGSGLTPTGDGAGVGAGDGGAGGGAGGAAGDPMIVGVAAMVEAHPMLRELQVVLAQQASVDRRADDFKASLQHVVSEKNFDLVGDKEARGSKMPSSMQADLSWMHKLVKET
jgi:hypothetical protein